MPKSLIAPLQEQIQTVYDIHKRDLSEGYGSASIAPALKRKYQSALTDFAWQYVFCSSVRCMHPQDGYICRHHIHPSAYTKKLRVAVKCSGINKRVTAHTFRHSFATDLLLRGSDIRTVQELLGHSDIRTTEIYTHVIGDRRAGTVNPIDSLKPKP